VQVFALGQATPSVSYSRVAGSTVALPDNFTYEALLNVTGDTTVAITIPSTTLTVQVQDTNGNPVAGATVTASEPWGGPPFWSVGTCTVPEGLSYSLCGITPDPSTATDVNGNNPALTDANGNVSVYILATDAYFAGSVNVSPPPGASLVAASTTIPADVESPTALTVQLPQSYTVQYRFLDSNGTVLSAANANLSPAPDVNGYYSEQVQAGTETASVSYSRKQGSTLALPDNFTYAALLSVAGNMTVDITIPSTTLTIHVEDSNNDPVGGATVTASEPWGGPPFWSVGTCTVPEGLSYSLCGITPDPSTATDVNGNNPALTDPNGNVTLYILATDAYFAGSVSVSPPAGASLVAASTTISADVEAPTTLTVQLPPSYTVQYRFLDSNGTVLTAANANLNPTPDANGYFTEQVPAGSESASVSYSRIANSTLALPDNFTYQALLNVTGNMTVDLTIPSTTLTVNVVDPNGVPVAGAEVTVSEPWGGPPFWSVGTCTVPEGLSYSLCGITPDPSTATDVNGNNPALTDQNGNVSLYIIAADAYFAGSVSVSPPAGTDLLGATGTCPADTESPTLVSVQLQ
jgi:hypothetical protein